MELAFTSGTLSLGVVFWIFMLAWLFLGFWSAWGPAPNYRLFSNHLLFWFLLFVLGWQVFGFPLGK